MTRYEKELNALRKAVDLCREGGCENAIPFIIHRIHWMEDNDYELGINN